MLDREDTRGTIFENMKQVNRPPVMQTINGVGATVYGRRDFDQETQTYVKTHVLCLVFFPILAIGAYRVRDCETGGWYFIGKVPLSGLAKGYNYLILALILAFTANVYWETHKNSPQYIAEQKLSEAQETLAAGKKLEAAGKFTKMVSSNSYHKDKALKALEPLLVEIMNEAKTGGEVVAAAKVINQANRANKNLYKDLYPKLKEKALKLSVDEKFKDSLQVLKMYLVSKADDKKMQGMKIFLLKKILEKDKLDHKTAIELAEELDKQGNLDEAVKVLEGREKFIVNTKAAAILGKYYYKNGKLDEALELLQPYIESEIKEMTRLETQYNKLYDSLFQSTANSIVRNMNIRNRDLTKAEIDKVRKTTEQKLLKNPSLERVRQDLIKKTEIVPIALDLGATRLSRAQSMPPGPLRNKELEKVEKQFLSIRNFAGNSNDYQYFLGQVYYWLGKDKEAAAVFGELEKNNAQNGNVLLAMSRVLREVGEIKEARRISEKVFETSKDNQVKSDAAMFRALVYTDLDDEIEWLKKSPIKDDSVNVHLNDALGRKAQDDDNDAEAEKYFRLVINSYSKMAKSASVYNNMGLVYQRLYEISGKLDDYRKGAEMLNEAVRLEPDNSILLGNTSSSLRTLALIDALEGTSDPKLFQYGITEIDTFIYDNRFEKAAFDGKYKSTNYKKSIEYLDKAVLLSPKNVSLLLSSISIHADDKNTDKLVEINNRLKSIKIDKADLVKNYVEALDKEVINDNIASSVDSLKKRVEWLKREDVKKNTFALLVAQTKKISVQLYLYYYYGQKVDLAALEKQVSNMLKVKSCFALQDTFHDVLLYEVIEEFAAKDSTYRDLMNKCRYSIKPWNALLYYIYKNPSKKSLLANSANLKKLLEQKKKLIFDYSEENSQDWFFFSLFDSSYAEKVKSSLMGKSYKELYQDLNYKVTSYVPSVVMSKYWTELMKGDSTSAEAVLENGLKSGVPMGYDLISKSR